ncbi:MAG: RNA methyltransferase [Candidatus Aminicenantales bacterium]
MSQDAPGIQKRVTVVLVRPERPENIGLVARSMKTTGFSRLRIVGKMPLDEKAHVTAVHARGILDRARFFSSPEEAVSDLNVVFASTAKRRKNFAMLSLEEAIRKILDFSRSTEVGLVFGTERTGLTSEELRNVNFCFTIPQATRQPSYNLGVAVGITLFEIWRASEKRPGAPRMEKPLMWREQQALIARVLQNLEAEGFIHRTNRKHMSQRISDLLGRLTLADRDRRLLLALFSTRRKGGDG